jgi:hypothetical protein
MIHFIAALTLYLRVCLFEIRFCLRYDKKDYLFNTSARMAVFKI